MHFNLKKICKKIHLWIGLFSGLIVIIICISGCIYTFQQEIKLNFISYYTVENHGGNPLNLSELLQKYESESVNKVLYIYDFTDPTRSLILRTTKNSQLYDSYINPYNGEILKEIAHKNDFFRIVLSLHRNLLLEKDLGREIVGYTVIIFIFSLITGLILWFPKNIKVFKSKKGRNSKLSIKKTKNTSRLLYDLHSVLGFYGSFILIILSVVGLGWTFTWVDNTLYSIVTFEKKEKLYPVVVNSTSLEYAALDLAKYTLDYHQRNRNLFFYNLPQTPTQPLKITAYPDDDSYGSSDVYYFHPTTAILIKRDQDINKKAGTKFRALYYDIHTGSLLGIWGKIIVFLAGIIGTSLPITGFLLWYRRKRRITKN